jgi:hypothetical protein
MAGEIEARNGSLRTPLRVPNQRHKTVPHASASPLKELLLKFFGTFPESISYDVFSKDDCDARMSHLKCTQRLDFL